MSYSAHELAALLARLADLSAVLGENRFKAAAYAKAAEAVEAAGDAAANWPPARWLEVPGIGKGTVALIGEYQAGGRIAELEALAAKVPPGVEELLGVGGIGPGTAATLWAAGFDSPSKVRAAIFDGSIRAVKGFGEKKAAAVAKSLAEVGAMVGRQRLGRAWPAAAALAAALRAAGARAEVAGEVRRGCETVGEALVLSTAAPDEKTMEAPAEVRIEVAAPAAFATRWVHATGPESHWRALVARARQNGLELGPDGLARGGTPVPLADEPALYAALGLPWIQPEWREQPLSSPPPALLEEKDILAELHSHTEASDGSLPLREMAEAAIARGCRVLAVTDHSRSSAQANGLSIERLLAQIAEIRRVQAELGERLTLLAGSEVDIHADGSLDYPDEVLAQLDWVVASPHAALTQGPAEATGRLVRAVSHPAVRVLGHPSGRLIGRRPGLAPDWDAVFAAAVAHGTALEINSNPMRLDLSADLARRALAAGAKLAINTDAHGAADLQLLHYGVRTARRAGATRADIVNAWPPERLLAFARGPRRP